MDDLADLIGFLSHSTPEVGAEQRMQGAMSNCHVSYPSPSLPNSTPICRLGSMLLNLYKV